MTSPLLLGQPAPAGGVGHAADALDAMIAGCPFDPAAMEAGCARVEQLARRHLLRAFQGEGIFVAAGERHSSAGLQQQLGVIPAYQPLFHLLIEMLAEDGVSVSLDGGITTSHLPDASPAACAALRDALLADHPDRAMLVPLVDACAPEALAVAGGRKSAVEVLFPGGSSALVENVYARDVVSGLFNSLTAHASTDLQPPQSLILAVNGDPEPASGPRVPGTEVSGLTWQQLQIIDAQLVLFGAKGGRP